MGLGLLGGGGFGATLEFSLPSSGLPDSLTENPRHTAHQPLSRAQTTAACAGDQRHRAWSHMSPLTCPGQAKVPWLSLQLTNLTTLLRALTYSCSQPPPCLGLPGVLAVLCLQTQDPMGQGLPSAWGHSVGTRDFGPTDTQHLFNLSLS